MSREGGKFHKSQGKKLSLFLGLGSGINFS